MKTQLEGTLVRFDDAGVGVIDVTEQPEFVYFKPAHIDGYRGETVAELASGGPGNWANGATVLIEADVDPSGNVLVSSVALKE